MLLVLNISVCNTSLLVNIEGALLWSGKIEYFEFVAINIAIVFIMCIFIRYLFVSVRLVPTCNTYANAPLVWFVSTPSALPATMVGDTSTSQAASSESSFSKKRRPKISAMYVLPGPSHYTLPGCTGGNNHDPSKKKNPVYSFGTKTKQFSSMGGNSCR